MIPVFRGHILSQEDLIVRQHILNQMCHFETHWTDKSLYIDELNEMAFKLREMETDGLVSFEKEGIKVTQKGQPYVRNVCMAFDVLLQRKQPRTRLFSMTV